MLVIGALALSVPAVTLAAGGGGSAGDQQYTDPFAGTSTPTSPTHTATSAPTTSATPTTPASPTTTAAPATSPPATTSDSPPVQPTDTIAADPTATIASTSTNQLPYTGYDGWLAATFGFVMVGGGLVLRRRAGRS